MRECHRLFRSLPQTGRPRFPFSYLFLICPAERQIGPGADRPAPHQGRRALNLRVSAFLDRMASLLSEGHLEAFAQLHRYPAVYEAQGTMRIYLRPEDLIRTVGEWRRNQWARGVRTITARVAAQDLGRSGRIRVWAEWTHHLADGTTTDGGTDLLYLSRCPGGCLAIEMIDFLSQSAPAETPEQPDAEALPAAG